MTTFDPAVQRRGPRPPEPSVDPLDVIITEHHASSEAAIARAATDFARLDHDCRRLARVGGEG